MTQDQVYQSGAFCALTKSARIISPLEPHQQRVVDQAQNENMLVAHTMGAGKTLTSIAAADKLGRPTEVFVPAPLTENYKSEIKKFTGGKSVPFQVHSTPRSAQRGYQIEPGSTMIVDEAHMARNPNAMRSQYLKAQAMRAGRVMLLTGTPVYNQPENIAPLVNMLSRRTVLPENPTEFRKRFIEETPVKPGFIGRLLGVKPGIRQDLKDRATLLKALRGKVDVFDDPPDLPGRQEKDVTVDMSPEQQNVYKYIEGSIPMYLKWKIRMNLPPNKAEAQALNAFSAGLRQSSNTPGPYTSGMSHLRAAETSPKMMTAFKSIQDRTKQDPNFKGLVYSNYMDAGVLPMASLLNRAGVPNAVYHGGLSALQKHKIVEDYNTGKLKVILGTSSATEGLNLKGTKLIQVMEPHFNESKTDQVIARGIRIGSHAHLPPEERNVMVERYFSKPRQGFLSRVFSGKRTGIDEYIRGRALEKQRLAQQIKDVFEEAQR